MNVLECHSRGDKRFSALYAIVKGRTIEQWYQSAKRDASHQPFASPKGQRPTYIHPIGGEDVPAVEVQYPYYRMLWHIYFLSHRELLHHATHFEGYHDRFETGGSHVYRPDDTALPQKCLQSVAIADIVGTLKRGERYRYPDCLHTTWNYLTQN